MNVDELSEELADEYEVSESEMFGFVGTLKSLGHGEVSIRTQASEQYGGSE